VSATALCASGKPVLSIDVQDCQPHVDKLRAIAPKFSFRKANSLEIDIPACGLLHIDSLHTCVQLKAELIRHHARVSRYIAMHDTETFGVRGQDKSLPGLYDAIIVFLALYPEWRMILHLQNNNGMTVLERCRT
jgi:hypothetical protein